MATSGRGARRLAVRINPTVWEEEVGRFAAGSPARLAAERERRGLEREGIALTLLLPCEPEGAEGTRLDGLVKAYVPISDRPASERPFGFIFSPEKGREGPYLELVAFGERHPELLQPAASMSAPTGACTVATPTSRQTEEAATACR